MTRAAVALALALGWLAASAPPAHAHPLGNFTVNRYSRVEVGPGETTLRYVLDLAEIPTLQELGRLGIANPPDERAQRKVLDDLAPTLARGAELRIAGRAVEWRERERALEVAPGEAGLITLRVALTLVGPGATEGQAIAYRDRNYDERTGWREIVLRGRDGLALSSSTAPADDVTNELRTYPSDPATPPLDVRTASATVGTVGAAAPVAAAGGPSRSGVNAAAEPLARSLALGSGGDLLGLVAALAIAASLGGLHAATPGHGKTVMAAYLVGTSGTARQALTLGAVVALSHTVGVLALALVILGASTAVAPERFYPALSALSALIVLGIGVYLVLRQLRGRRLAPSRAHEHDHVLGHDHGHGEHHAHSHDRALRHGDDRGQHHAHSHEHGPSGRVGWRALVALGVSGGAIPSASALLLLLAAASLRRPELGVALIVAFGVGMAAVLVGLGIALVTAGRFADRFLAERPLATRARALLPAATALAVLAVGVGLTIQAVAAIV